MLAPQALTYRSCCSLSQFLLIDGQQILGWSYSWYRVYVANESLTLTAANSWKAGLEREKTIGCSASVQEFFSSSPFVRNRQRIGGIPSTLTLRALFQQKPEEDKQWRKRLWPHPYFLMSLRFVLFESFYRCNIGIINKGLRELLSNLKVKISNINEV